jgi:CBS domain-containing membrane protein
MGLGMPLLLPAVGASAYLVFADPTAPVSAPRSVLLGHALAAAIGWGLLELCGLAGEPNSLAAAVSWPRVAAVAGALAATIGTLRALRCSHPPAGATTMIVAMGLLPQARHLPAFLLASAVVVAHAAVACRLAGIDYPRT